MNYTLYLLLLCVLLARPTFAQIGMGGQPHSSAVLDLKSPANDKALYPPRLTSAQRKSIVNPQPGAFVYDLDKGTFYMFDGQNWSPLAFTSANNLAPIDRFASDGQTGDSFGYSVAISGDYALIGAFADYVGVNFDQGSAYVFVRSGNTWTQQAKLTASDGATSDRFGLSVAISGDYALVGAYLDDMAVNQGSAYVFMRSGTTWTQQAKLTASDGTTSDFFGISVALSGDYALVGAFRDDIGANNDQGSAYVFMRSGNTWTQQAKLIASDGASGETFGQSVAISGDYAVVGASLDAIGGNAGQGSAYVFVRGGGTWTQQTKLIASDGAANDNFGYSVAISGDYALVGAFQDDIGVNSDQGSAYVFVRSGAVWSQQAKLTASDGASADEFGISVSLSGDYAVAGAYKDNIGANGDQGSVYLFRRTGSTWPLVRNITDNSPAGTQNGTGVGISNGSFIIGGSGFESEKGKVSFGTVEN